MLHAFSPKKHETQLKMFFLSGRQRTGALCV